MTVATHDASLPSRTAEDAQRDELILGHLGLVKQVVSRIALRIPAHIDRDDLIEAGMVGLVDAAHRFEPERNVRFSTYATTRVRGAVFDALRNEDWLPRSLRNEMSRLEEARLALSHEATGPAKKAALARRAGMSREKVDRLERVAARQSFVSLDDLPVNVLGPRSRLVKSRTESDLRPEARAMLAEQKRLLAESIQDLHEKERTVISLYYFEGLNLREIADILGVTNSRVCQIHRAALKQLKRILARADSRDLAVAMQ